MFLQEVQLPLKSDVASRVCHLLVTCTRGKIFDRNSCAQFVGVPEAKIEEDGSERSRVALGRQKL